MLFLFMEELIEILEFFVKLDANELLFEIYQQDSFQKFVIDLNTEDQLRLGLDAEGNLLRDYISIGYSLEKDKIPGRKAPFGIVDLFVSGRMYRTWRVNPLKDGFELIADTDLYGPDFNETLGEGGVIGIMDENIEKLVSLLEESLLDRLNKKIGL